MVFGLEVVGVSSVSLVLEFSALSGDRVVVPVVECGAASWRSVSFVWWLNAGECAGRTAETDRVVDGTVVRIADAVVSKGSDSFARGVGSSIALLDLVLDAELRIVSVQRTESIVEADETVTRAEWWLVVGTATLSGTTVGSRPDGFALPVLGASRLSRVNFCK